MPRLLFLLALGREESLTSVLVSQLRQVLGHVLAAAVLGAEGGAAVAEARQLVQRRRLWDRRSASDPRQILTSCDVNFYLHKRELHRKREREIETKI